MNTFPNILIDEYDWLRNPFIGTMQKELNLSFEEEEQLIDIKNDRNLSLQFKEMPLDTFLIHIKDEYPGISKKTLKILIQFSTSYLCKLWFYSLTNIESKKRKRLQPIDKEMRVWLSTISPNIKDCCKSKEAYILLKQQQKLIWKFFLSFWANEKIYL